MEFLNQFAKQISELFRSMTPASRITTALLFCLVVVGLFLMFSGKVSQSEQYLFSGESFTSTQLQLMQVAFAEEGLDDYSVDGSRIKIKGNPNPYIAALGKHKALPPGCNDPLREALTESSIFQLPKQFDVTVQDADAKKLSNMLSGIHMIEWTSTMSFRKKTRGLFDKGETCSATVMVGTKLGETLTTKLAGNIQQTASTALGIPAANITITDARTGHAFSGNLSSGDVAANQLKNDYEAQWVERIQDLWPIPGMTVAVNVELDPYKKRKEVTFTPDKKPVTKMSYSKTNNINRKAPVPGGRPGFSSNQPNRLIQTANQMSTDTEKGSEDIQDNVIGSNSEEVEYATGRQKQVNVSILIPTEHFVKIWRGQNPTPEGEEPKKPTAAERDVIATSEIAKVKKSIANLLSMEGIQDPTKFVDVSTYESPTLPPLEGPGMMTKAASWFGQYWTVLGLLVLGLFSLRMLRNAMRAVPVEIAEPERTGTEPKAATGETTQAAAKEMLRRFEAGGPSLRDELSVLVNQDADAAATILSTWIGNPNAK